MKFIDVVCEKDGNLMYVASDKITAIEFDKKKQRVVVYVGICDIITTIDTADGMADLIVNVQNANNGIED